MRETLDVWPPSPIFVVVYRDEVWDEGDIVLSATIVYVESISGPGVMVFESTIGKTIRTLARGRVGSEYPVAMPLRPLPCHR